MVCNCPARFNGVLAPCGQCRQCRVNRKEAWATRIEMEFLQHPASTLATLTYNAEHYPASIERKAIRRTLQLFFKRLRKGGVAFRYFAATELGGRTKRLHHHVLLFGVEANSWTESTLQKAWSIDGSPIGFVNLRPVRDSGVAAYVCKYILKNMKSEDSSPDEEAASFALMSRRPGIGAPTLDVLAEQIDSQGILSASSLGVVFRPETGTMETNFSENSKVTSGASVRLDGRLKPLDRYSRNRLFPEKEGATVTRIRTLMNSIELQSGGSFSDVVADAERLLEARARGAKALARVRRSQL